MTKKNGHDDSNVTRFPDAHEREVLEKAHIVHPPPPKSEPAFNLPPAVKILCLANIGVFLLTEFFPGLMTEDLLYRLTFVPARYSGNAPLDMSAILSPFTHLFIHAGWLHISLNVGMLMAFGAGIEKTLGARKFLLLYFASGLFGALLHAVIYPATQTPMIGASGAISGLFGGVLMLMYKEGMMGEGYKKLLPFVFVWIGISAIFGLFGMPGTDNPVAWTAHIGGFFAGLFLYNPVSRIKLPR